ncbi:DUF3560 domain-containing protein [Nannocystis pusilla]|uniref:DUF3560 domain-containing protein n=1 Tax=Nannocystis pusilla TaxID=889268 RepID=A0ABS7TN54_9BACT|nr:DUF3560 domain-containing protein [Nannocystis pusilla]MBZ5709663.1 DUF3560 domain-containing protein [Nannocystis pusilla]
MNVHVELQRRIDAFYAAVPPDTPRELADAFVAKQRAVWLAKLTTAHAAPCEARPVAPPAEPSPDDLQRDVLEVVYDLLDIRPHGQVEIAKAVRAKGLKVGPEVLRRWLYGDPYIRYDDRGDEFHIIPRSSEGTAPPSWVDRVIYNDRNGRREVLFCTGCRADVPIDSDWATIRHRPLCPNGPLQFAAHKLPRIEKLLEDLNGRARRLGVGGGLSLRVVREFRYPVHVGKHPHGDPGYDCTPTRRPSHWEDLPHVEVQLDGEVPKVPGWKVLGVLEHTAEEDLEAGVDTGVIVREAPGETVPARYRSAGPDCEHCQVRRRRKDTVILQDKDGNVKQVGRSCLADYTGSSDAESRIKAFLAWQEHWGQIRELMDDHGLDEQWAMDAPSRVLSLARFLAWVARCVHSDGFVSAKAEGQRSSSSNCALAAHEASKQPDADRTAPEPEYLAQGEEARAWARENLVVGDDKSTFDHNLAVIVKRDYVDFRTARMAVWIFQKWRQAKFPRTFEQNRSEWRPESVGEKVTMRLAVKRVHPEASESQYGPRDLYVLADDAGREVVLFTAAANGPDEGDVVELKAEILKHDSYRGRKQTLIAKRSRGWTIVERGKTERPASAEPASAEPAELDGGDIRDEHAVQEPAADGFDHADEDDPTDEEGAAVEDAEGELDEPDDATSAASVRPAWTGRADYAERRQARVSGLEAAARGRAAQADRLTRESSEGLPDNGQPILVGHHSEGRHRRMIERSHTKMRKSIELADEAENLQRRANAAAKNRAISSDDPDAIEKIRAKIDHLEESSAQWKTINRAVRSKDPHSSLAALGVSPRRIDELLKPDFAGRVGIPDYQLSNTRAEIRRLKERLTELEQAATTAAPEPVEIDGAEARWETEENRIIVELPPGTAARPLTRDEKRRRSEIMRHWGFVWSDSRGAYVRKANQHAWRAAIEAMKSLAKSAVESITPASS